MKKMSEFLDLPVEPAFRETQVILTGKRLEISCYTAFEMCVCGRIESILLEEGKKK